MSSHYLNQCWQNCQLHPTPMKFHSKYQKKSFKKMHLKMVSAEQVLKQTKSWRLCNAYLLYRESTSTQRACNVKKSPIGFQHGPLWNADNSNWIFPCKKIPIVLRFFQIIKWGSSNCQEKLVLTGEIRPDIDLVEVMMAHNYYFSSIMIYQRISCETISLGLTYLF